MKINFILIFLSFVAFLSCKKTEINATLNISVELENKNSKEYADLSYLKIYKNDTIFKEIIADDLPFIQHSIKLSNLK